ncbi:MAG: hypothetical protein KGK07_04805 [Chloroflexota bacterium]|nr:hypothetical protein [Chloroflexota bacterium]
MVLEEERTYFETHKSELLARYRNQYVLIKGSNLIGAYPSAEAAYVAGLEKLGVQPFLVRQVLDHEPVGVVPMLSVTPSNARL